MIFDNQLRHASGMIAAYQGGTPLHVWLKNFFRENKKMGSKDRRLLSTMVYGFYRLGHVLKDLPIEERLLVGLFLGNDKSQEFLQYFKPQWNEKANLPPEEKIAWFRQSDIDFDPACIFPWKEDLSPGIDPVVFGLSFLRQPDLFLRIRPGFEQKVIIKLKQAALPYTFLPPFTLRLSNGSKVETLIRVNEEVVIQDYSSQRTAPFLETDPSIVTPGVWDACAASGGKSILAFDLNPSINLTVSDIRESILRNLRERFREARIKKYRSFTADLGILAAGESYDLVIADVPCSGSGTWGRTPEELYFFDKKKIVEYREAQRRIVSNLVRRVRPGGHFVYLTCSVFREENEGQVDFILEHSDLKLEKMDLLKGYDQRADTLFAARFIRPAV